MMTSQELQPVAEMLNRVARELDDLARSVDDLHALVETNGRKRFTARAGFMHQAQSIDLVEQRLSSLSHFLVELAGLVPPEWEVHSNAAAQKLKLSALAMRLSSKESGEAVAVIAGESEFF